MKSKRARESATEAEADVLPVNDDAPPEKKKRKRSGGGDDDDDDEAANRVKQKQARRDNKDSKDKKGKNKDKKKDYKETRREKKDKRKNLQDLPEEDVGEEDEGEKVEGQGQEQDEQAEVDGGTAKKDKSGLASGGGTKGDGQAVMHEAEPAKDKKKEQENETEKKKREEKKDKKKDKKEKQKKSSATAAAADDDAAAPAAQAQEAAPEPDKPARHIVFVGNLPFSATAASIRAHFAALDPISVRCLKNKGDARPCRGIAFVEFAHARSMRTCLDKFHHSVFEDGVSEGRKINVELTAGGGGSTQFRKDKIRQKNNKLDENRAKRIDKENNAKSAKQQGKKQPGGGGAGPAPAGIHPSRLARNPGLGG
ncbi:hypothetical protein E4U41_004107 [Claviceps citrina]|nr:hypothetical protein E4U41_004107 [Claviceps citrina]